MEFVVAHNNWHLSKRKIENCLFLKCGVFLFVFVTIFGLNHLVPFMHPSRDI